MLGRVDDQRENLIRAALTALVVLVVLVMVVLDRRGADEPATTAATPPAPTVQTTPALPEGTAVPLPAPTTEPKKRRGTKGQPIPAPPDGLDALVCRTLARPVPLTVLSFNMHRGHGGLERVAAEIARTGADIVLLQEVDRFVQLTGRVDQAARLAERLRMYGVFGANIPRGGGQYGTAILSRYEILEWRNTPLPNSGRAEQRGLLHATIEVGGRPVSIYNTHLQFGPSPLQLVQARAVARILAADERPKILGGDLNVWPASRPMGALYGVVRDPWTSVGRGPGGTGPRGGRIDYVLVDDQFTPTDSVVLQSATSDHNAVRTELTLAPGECPD